MASAIAMDLDQALLEQATARHRAGDVDAARRLYRQLLEASPDHAQALFRSGLLELQDGHPQQALVFIDRAVALDPNEPRHALGLGQVLQTLGRHADAEAVYRNLLRAEPLVADGWFGLALALQAESRHAEAVDPYQRVLELEPQHFAALNNVGNCLQRCGRLAEAVEAYTRALAVRPEEIGTLANLGTVLGAVGRTAEAIRLLGTVVEREPLGVAHRINLGIALCRERRFADAEAVLHQAVALDAGSPDAAFNLGNALAGLGSSREAAQLFRRAAELRPGFADASINLGNMHRALGENSLAAQAYEAALRAQPRSVAALNNLACLERSAGHLDAAEDGLRRALELEPGNAALHDNLGSVLKDAGDLPAAVDCFRRSIELDPDGAAAHGNLAYALSFQCPEPQPILAECRRWGRRFGDPHAAHAAHINDRDRNRRLKIGYVSPNFREHCQALFCIPLLSHHDHANFEIVCYSSVERPDQRTRQLAGHADAWRDVRALDDAALARVIRADHIDILVDLTMHMAHGRLLTFARRPAPIQIAWLAYPGTTGLAAMDYRLTDPVLDPPGSAAHYTERSIRLPNSFWCYAPLTHEPAVNPLPALTHGRVTFGCLNNPCKLTAATLALWGGVLRALPDARLVLLAPTGRHRTRLAARLHGVGIHAARVDFVGYQDRAQYLRTYHAIDVSLDTVPYNGHTTSLDSLWMGVPTVTRVGNTCVGRGGLSQLTQLGLEALAATSDARFVETAVALCQDLGALARLRGELRMRLERSPLMDAARFARDVEAVYRRAWLAYCDGDLAFPAP